MSADAAGALGTFAFLMLWCALMLGSDMIARARTCRARTTRDREVEAAMRRHPAGSRR